MQITKVFFSTHPTLVINYNVCAHRGPCSVIVSLIPQMTLHCDLINEPPPLPPEQQADHTETEGSYRYRGCSTFV